MADSSNIPSWAVPAKGSAAPDTPAPVPQNTPPASGGDDFVDKAVDGIKNFFGGLFGKKSAPTQTTTPSTPTVPSWAIPAKAGSKPAASSTPTTPQNPTAPKQQVPSWAIAKQAPTQTPDGPVAPSKFGNISGVDTTVEGGTQKTFDPASNEALGPDFINSLPGSAVKVAKDIAQSVPRTAASIGVLLGQTGKIISNAVMGVDTSSLSGIQVPDNMKWVMGDGTINSPAQEIDAARTAIQNSPLAKKLGIDKFATQLGFAGVLGNDALTFSGFGEGDAAEQTGRDAVISLLQDANTTEEVLPILEQIKMNPSIAEDLAPHLAQMTEKSEISDALDLAQQLQHGIQALPDMTDNNNAADETPPEKTYSGSAIDQAQSQIQTTYASVPTEVLHENVGSILTEMDLAEPGSRLITGTGSERIVTAIPSTFPQWIPENLRSSDLFSKVIDYLNPDSEKFGTFPPANRPKQRALVYELYNELDKRTGVDTASFRNDIISEYNDYDESNQREIANTPNRSAKGSEIDVNEAADKFGGSSDDQSTESNGGTQDVGNIATIIHPGDEPPEPVTTKAPNLNDVKSQIPETVQAESQRMQSIKDLMRNRFEQAKAENESKKNAVDATQPESAASSGDQLAAINDAYDGGIQKGPFKGWKSENVKAFQDFVNRRKDDTLKAVGAVVRKKFEPLRTEGLDAILRFEGFQRDPDTGNIVEIPSGPDRSGLLGEVSKANDDLFTSEKESGVPVNYRQNYLRIYIKDPGTGEVFIDGVPMGGRQLGRRPGFSLPREFKTNAEALQAGYTLLYPNIPDLMQQRAMDSERAIANSDFFNHLTTTGNAVPSSLVAKEAGGSFISFDPDRFPTKTVKYENKVYSGTFKGPAPIVEKVNQYLKEPNKFLKSTSAGFGSIKNFALSIGIPKTGFSVHYWNMLPREVLSDLAINPLSAPLEIAKFLYYGLNTGAARSYIEDNIEKSIPFMRAGLTFSSEEHPLDALDLSGDKTIMDKVGTTGKWISNFLHDTFSKNLFSRIIPARKLYQVQRLFTFATKNGMAEDEAYRWAAIQVNNLYGGINWEQLGRSKDWQNFMRSILMAPDYAESNINIGTNMAKSFGRLFKTPSAEQAEGEEAIKAGSVTGKLYRNIAYSMVALYITADTINYETTGKHLFQNDPLHQLSLAYGHDSAGRTRYINAFGTGADFVRIPMQIATALAQGKMNDVIAVLRNRLSIPVAAVMSMISNTDWAGQRIYGPDIYGNPQSTSKQIQNVLNNTIGAAAPSSITSLENVASGYTSPEQALIQGLALPVGYVNEKPNATTIKQLEADAKEGIANGDYTLYNQLVKAKVISSRSRATFIRDALTAGGKTAKQLKTSAKDKARIAAEEKALQAEGFKKSE